MVLIVVHVVKMVPSSVTTRCVGRSRRPETPHLGAFQRQSCRIERVSALPVALPATCVLDLLVPPLSPKVGPLNEAQIVDVVWSVVGN